MFSPWVVPLVTKRGRLDLTYWLVVSGSEHVSVSKFMPTGYVAESFWTSTA